MDLESDMEGLRVRIRAALAADPSKSQKELAKLLGISPAQVTSLLKRGGRRLQAAEVPIVERYLGIRLFRAQESRAIDLAEPLSEYVVSPLVAARAVPDPRQMMKEIEAEGTLVALEDVPAEMRNAMENLLETRPAEFWRLTADGIHDAGYVSGDYLIVDRSESPRKGDIVLAEVRQSAGRWTPIFRAYAPPELCLLNSKAGEDAPLKIGDPWVAVIGPVVASFRTRERK